MRLIDADAIRIKPEYMHDICGVAMIRVEDIARILNDMPTIEPEPDWIPCSKQLPEVDDVYLVYAPSYTGGSSSAKECHNGVMFSKFKNKKWSIEHGYHKRPNCVRAWMPLLEPYQPDGFTKWAKGVADSYRNDKEKSE